MTSFRPTPTAAVLGLCIALGPAIAGFFIYKGLVERIEKADRGTLEITFKVTGNDLNTLYKKISADGAIVKPFILKQGFVESEISQSAPRVTDLHAREWGSGALPPERYLIEYTLSVNSQKVDGLNSLSAKTGELLSQGISISNSFTNFYLDRFNELRPELIAAATQNALEVAKSFAKTTGSKIGGIRKASQGVIQLTSPDASPNQSYDEGISSLMKKIRVVSTLEFYIK